MSTTPPPGAAFVENGGTWSALTSTGPQGAQPVFTPPPVGLYAYNSGLGQWVPWTGSGGGGAPSGPAGGDLTGTYPNPQVDGTTNPGTSTTPGFLATGTLATGTNAAPYFYINQGATAPTTFSAGGTEIGINAPSGFAGNFLDFRVNGAAAAALILSASGQLTSLASVSTASGSVFLTTNKAEVSASGQVAWSSTASAQAASDTSISRVSAGVLQIGSGAASGSTGSLKVGQILGGSGAPAVAAGAGAGTTPTVSILGNNSAGQVSVTTGTSPTASAAVVTVTFANSFAYGAAPYPMLTPANAAAAGLSGTSQVFVTATTTTFVINVGSAALAAATQYLWNYSVQG